LFSVFVFMPLSLHLTIHFSLAIIVGYFCGRLFKKPGLGIIVGIMGGFLIDLDHVLEYFLVFGPTFNFQYFIESRQFLISDKIRLFFHAWEYFPILLALAFIFRKKQNLKVIFFTLAISGAVHLVSDVVINGYYFKYYSLLHRSQLDFSAVRILPPEIYQLNQEYKKKLGI
jgi:phosphoglycerol transferase MdoB-like AlkP superfamily enzyme